LLSLLSIAEKIQTIVGISTGVLLHRRIVVIVWPAASEIPLLEIPLLEIPLL